MTSAPISLFAGLNNDAHSFTAHFEDSKAAAELLPDENTQTLSSKDSPAKGSSGVSGTSTPAISLPDSGPAPAAAPRTVPPVISTPVILASAIEASSFNSASLSANSAANFQKLPVTTGASAVPKTTAQVSKHSLADTPSAGGYNVTQPTTNAALIIPARALNGSTEEKDEQHEATQETEPSYGPAKASVGPAAIVASTVSEVTAKESAPFSVTRMTHADTQAPLSFAAKVDIGQGDSGAASDGQAQQFVLGQNVSSVASAWKKDSRDAQAADAAGGALTQQASSPAAVLNDAAINAISNAMSRDTGIAATSLPAPVAAGAPRETAAIETPTEVTGPTAGAPLKDISFNVAEPGGSSVQLRLVERAGELRVSVHAASPELNQDLRAGLPDLTKKLTETGLHSEVWRPAGHTAASDGAQPSKHQGGNSGGSNSQPQSGSQQGRRQRNQNPQRPQWVEELQNGMQKTASTTGDNNGFGN
jgi:hypothetical protein